jgi:hypothetical protein
MEQLIMDPSRTNQELHEEIPTPKYRIKELEQLETDDQGTKHR